MTVGGRLSTGSRTTTYLLRRASCRLRIRVPVAGFVTIPQYRLLLILDTHTARTRRMERRRKKADQHSTTNVTPVVTPRAPNVSQYRESSAQRSVEARCT